MNGINQKQDEARLRALLRESKSTSPLPPRFQENVWRRIERVEVGQPGDRRNWLDALVNLVLRPRLAFAAVAVLVLMGTVLGVREGVQTAHHEAQARYLTAVAPDALR